MRHWYAIYSSILHLYFSAGYYRLPESAKDTISPTKPIRRLLKIAGYTLVRLVGNLFQSVENPESLQGKVWLYVVSQNNYDSLKFIPQELPEAVFVAGQNKNVGRYRHQVARISLRSKLFYYYKFLPLFFLFLRDKRRRALRFFDILFDAVGFHEVYLRKLQKYRPQAIVFANDHNTDARAMLLAARRLGIKTIYIQHASVSTLFPPLQFSLSLLEGQDSLDKYRQCGPVAGRVELIGMPKADAFVAYRNQHARIQAIGISFNPLDDTGEIEQLLRHLTQDFPATKIMLRPHPRDTRPVGSLLAVSPSISLSDSRSVSSFDYLRHLDAQISGTSGIHLEAVLLNVWSIFYSMNAREVVEDYYGFIRHGLVEAPADYAALRMLLQQHLDQKPQVYERARYYSATAGTAYDGRSGALALKHIKAFIG